VLAVWCFLFVCLMPLPLANDVPHACALFPLGLDGCGGLCCLVQLVFRRIRSFVRQAEYGHGELKVVNATSAHFAWHRDMDKESTTTDEVWVTNPWS